MELLRPVFCWARLTEPGVLEPRAGRSGGGEGGRRESPNRHGRTSPVIAYSPVYCTVLILMLAIGNPWQLRGHARGAGTNRRRRPIAPPINDDDGTDERRMEV